MVITLIGYRGCGKTSIAKPLAAALGWDATDADAEIEQCAGKTIRKIFNDDGEPRFREIERQIMAELLTRDQVVIAAGGGAVLDDRTRREIAVAGPVVWLKANVETIVDRLQADQKTAQQRPNLTAQGGRDEIEELLAKREPYYRECATLEIVTDHLTTDEIVEIILRSVRSIIVPGDAS